MRRRYSPERKATALAALLAGQAVHEVAAEYRIPRAKLYGWKSKHNGSGSDLPTEKKDELAVLLLDYLTVTLRTLAVQAERFADAEWLARQDAADVAVLHGVMVDKAVRLLEALGKTADLTPSTASILRTHTPCSL